MKLIKKFLGTAVFCVLFLMVSQPRLQPVSLERKAPDTIEAEIKGEVVSPGVYTLKNGANIDDLIEAAGGKTPAADDGALRLSKALRPGEVIVVGKLNREGVSEKISISTASAQELQMLPGVGKTMAKRIVEYREKTPFSQIEDLMKIKGIGEKKFEKMKEYLAL